MKRRTIIFALVTGSLMAFIVPSQRANFGELDFLRYWASSHLLVTGGDPYNSAALFSLEHALRPELIPEGEVVHAWNPPWLMLTLAPLGLLSFGIASQLWVFSNVVLISVALSTVWKWLVGPTEQRGVVLALAAGFLYGETYTLIRIGQIGSLVLLGLIITVGRLRSQPDFKRDALAGVALLLMTVKPHIMYLALVLIFIGVFRCRRWGMLVGSISAALFSIGITWVIFPNWFEAYISTLAGMPFGQIYTSTVGSFMAVMFGIEVFRFSAILLVPLLVQFVRLTDIDWLTGINAALLLSVPLSPYGFSNDHIVLIPAVIQMIYWLWRGTLPAPQAWIVISGLGLVYGLDLWMNSLGGVLYSWLFWPPLVLFCLYWFALKAQTHAPAYAAV
jgi:hypothetical protein